MSLANKKRVLVVIVGDYKVTGVVSYLETRLPRLIERCSTDITLFVPGRIIEEERADVLRSSGVLIVEGHVNLSNPLSRRAGIRKALRKILSVNSFDAIHVNTGSRLVTLISLSEAKRAGIPTRIAHSHTANFTLGKLARAIEPFYQKRIGSVATDCLACSNEAGIFLFGEKTWTERGIVIPNGIDVNAHVLSLPERESVRHRYVTDQTACVFGFIGRFSDEKNPLFATRTFIEIAKQNETACFWFVGDGQLLDDAKELAASSGLEDEFVFFGSRNDVPLLLQGMDALLIPSKWEGFSLVLLEGQAAGLPCFVSDTVPEISYVPGCPVTYLPLDKGESWWAEQILDSDLTRNLDGTKMVREAGFDLEESIDSLTSYYSV